MKIHRFFLNNPLGEDIIIKEKSLLHQWNNVLKFKAGETLTIFNDSINLDFIYKIGQINKKEVLLTYKEKLENLSQKNLAKNVSLCISLIKKENLDLVLEKCTELGIVEFIPIISERTEKKNIVSFNKERGEKIIREAVEQSGWGNLPRLNQTIKLENLLKNLESKGEIERVYVMDIVHLAPEGGISSSLTLPREKESFTYLLIGPEGGWTDSERELFKKYSLKTVSFGKNTLRAETAAIVGCFKFLN